MSSFLTSKSVPPQPTAKGFALFALGFRPFFLVAGLSAVFLVGLWIFYWSGTLVPNSYYRLVGWHAHEMLFGYTAAVIAGFLLTAVRNWTGVDTAVKGPLAMLVSLWLAGRVAPLIPGMPGPLIAALDLLFLPFVAVVLGGPLAKGENRMNRVFLPVFALMTMANLLVHLDALGIYPGAGWAGFSMMRYLILLLILLVTGRVMPFFTESALPQSKPRNRPLIEGLSFSLLALLWLTDWLFSFPWAMGLAATAMTAVQLIRVAGWYHRGIWRIPILWVLYTGYGWLIVGFGLQALAGFGVMGANLALHAMTVGGVGILTLGMMARVSLGHTGRAMQSVGAMNIAFVMLNLGAVCRVFGPVAAPQIYFQWVHLSGGFWMIAFAIFCWIYGPILIRPRVDGKAG